MDHQAVTRRAVAAAAMALWAAAAWGQQLDPRLLDARAVWENYDQLRARNEADQAAQYRDLKQLYAQFKAEDLSSVDRLGKIAATLRTAYLEMPQGSAQGYEEGIRRSLVEFHSIIRAAKGAVERVDGYEALAVQFGVNVAKPTPPIGLVEDVVQTGILMTVRLPNTGRTYGAALSAILNDAIPLYPPEERVYLKDAIANLIEIDGGDIAGTSRLQAELHRVAALMSSTLVSDADNLERLRDELGAAGQRWKAALPSVQNRCNCLILADQYADRLFGRTLLLDAKAGDALRDELVLRSLYALRDTLGETSRHCTGASGLALLKKARAKLLERLLDWGYDEWVRAINAPTVEERLKKLERMTQVLPNFVDDTEFLQKEQQALVHAYLAQVYTIMAEDKKAMAHYQKARNVLPIAELEHLAKQRGAAGTR